MVGGLIGYPCFRLRGAFFSLVTIAFAEMLRVGAGIHRHACSACILNGVCGPPLPVAGDRPRGSSSSRASRPYYYVMLALLLAVLAAVMAREALAARLLPGPPSGTTRRRSPRLGVNPACGELAAMMTPSSFFAAIGGTFYAQLVGFITPTRTMSVDFSVQMVVMAVLGGVGTVLGPVRGALVLVPIAETHARRVGWQLLQGVHLIVYGAPAHYRYPLYWPQGDRPMGCAAVSTPSHGGSDARRRPRSRSRTHRAPSCPSAGCSRPCWRQTGARRC